MERLLRGIYKFQGSFFKKEKDFFKRLSKKQSPDVLFITCADSRIDPNLITQSKPGELFIIRNIGNIIPPFPSIKDKNSVAAAIEFAVIGLKVTDIIVCGHSNCGAMQVLIKDSGDLDNMPHLKEWLGIALPVKNILAAFCHSLCIESLQRIAEEENILLQLKHIQTYPFVEHLLKRGTLHLHGWHYDIGTGSVHAYNPDENVFKKITEQ